MLTASTTTLSWLDAAGAIGLQPAQYGGGLLVGQWLGVAESECHFVQQRRQ